MVYGKLFYLLFIRESVLKFWLIIDLGIHVLYFAGWFSTDIGAIMHVTEMSPLRGAVSWTCNPVTYFLHVVDRTMVSSGEWSTSLLGGTPQVHNLHILQYSSPGFAACTCT